MEGTVTGTRPGTKRRSHQWLTWMAGGAGAGLLVAVAAFVLYATVWTVSFTIDGRPMRLRADSTVGDLFSRHIVVRKPGNLVSAKTHRLLKPGVGGQPFVSMGGQVLTADSKLVRSATLVSCDGTDTTEPTRVETETIPIPTRYVGSGPIVSVIETGSPGVRRVVVGTISNEVVRKKQIVAPVARVVSRVEPNSGAKVVALTFDDGPWPGSTKAILKVLKKYGVKATFFEIGQQARRMPALSRAVADAGMELGNHSETHPLTFGHLPASAVASQIKVAENNIFKASGQKPKFLRPPGGFTNPAMYPVLSKLNMGWILWDVDTDDWKRPGSGAIVSRVMRHVRPGAVVLMHDGGGDRSQTVKALPTIIKNLKAAGYSFVTVDELPKVPHTMG